MTLKQQAAQLWSQGRTIAQIQSALRVTVSMPGGIGDIQRNFSTGNFAVHPEMCFVQPDKSGPAILNCAGIFPVKHWLKSSCAIPARLRAISRSGSRRNKIRLSIRRKLSPRRDSGKCWKSCRRSAGKPPRPGKLSSCPSAPAA